MTHFCRSVLLASNGVSPYMFFLLPSFESLTSASLWGLSHIAGIAHPTIRDAQHGVAVLQKFASDFQVPSPGEGYDHIIYIRPEDQPRPEYTRDDVLSILGRLKASTRDSGPNFRRSNGGYSRTHQTRGYRGRGGYRAFSPARGTLYGSVRFMHRAEGPNNVNWGHPGPDVATNRERSNQRSAVAADVPPMESSKGGDSAGERHNSC